MPVLKNIYFFADFPDEQPCFTFIDLDTLGSQGIDLLSPNFPANYDNNEFCYWIVQAKADQVVKLEFLEWDVSITMNGTEQLKVLL